MILPLRALREKLLLSQRAQSEMHAENAERFVTLCGNSFAIFALKHSFTKRSRKGLVPFADNVEVVFGVTDNHEAEHFSGDG